MINTIISDLHVPPISHIRNQKKDKSYENPFREEGLRDQKSPRVLVAPPAPKISEILEPIMQY